MNFTKNQQNAIDVRDCSLIISAGAGSGKTAVLTERILERICDENDDCNIDDFLIVTFTNAAAKELSDRIRKKLSQRASVMPGNKKIINNIALLPLAKISTINSFCYEIVRNNFQKLGLPASVRIADDAEMAIIREKLMNSVLDEYFENGEDEDFINVFETFSSSKNDKGFVQTLLELDNKLRCLPDPEGFKRSILRQYDEISEKKEFFDTSLGKILKENTLYGANKTLKVIEKLMSKASEHDVLVKAYMPSLECEYNFLRQIIAGCEKGYEEVKKCIESAVKISFKAVKNFEFPLVKDIIKDCKNLVAGDFRKELSDMFSCDKETLALAAKDTKNVISKLFGIIDTFCERLYERKRELSVMEFSDAERYALTLLVEKSEPLVVTDTARQLRDEFKEIYIDEYQDVNPLQDLIFRAISRHSDNGSEYSRFMVGDIKQSIYRFRGARSDIFMSYRDSFKDVDEVSDTKRIFMSDNFRCCESVIELTNLIFKSLMKEYYTEGDSLFYSRNEQNKTNYKVNLISFGYNKDEAEGFTSDVLEAGLICKKIKEIVHNPLYLSSDGKEFSYSDIGILTRSKSALKTYEAFLEANGVPVLCDVGESFFDKKETLLCLNILNSIDNPERDIYLAGFMRSFAGGFTDDELAVIKKEYRKMSLYKAVRSYGENMNDGLAVKCREFVEKLREYRHFSRGKSAEKLVWKIYSEMDILNRCSSDYFTNDKKGTRKNLLKLYQMARDFSRTSFHGLGAFIEYLNGAMQKSDVKSERDSASDCVRLMTIHASKGLEFPVCFVSNLSKKFNKSDESSKLVFSEKAGVATTLCDTGMLNITDASSGLLNINTPFRKLINSQIDKELTDEEIRILYVAMTRARDMLFLTGALPKKTENTMKDALLLMFSGDMSYANNYMSLLLGVLSDKAPLKPLYDAAGIDADCSDRGADDFLECSFLTCREITELCLSLDEVHEQKTESQVYDGCDQELLGKLSEYSSCDISYDRNPSKLTVSQLKKGLIDEEKTSEQTSFISADEPIPRFILGDGQVTGAEMGTAMHMFMQFCDFKECETGCEKEADRLLEQGFIDKTQRELLDLQRLDEFFGSGFYKKLSESKRIYREQRFNLCVDAFDVSLSGNILIQGVIDLFYENDDGTYTVVDFKTDRVFGEGAEEILIDRHRTQLMYYKRAVEEITGSEVSEALIYSFSLMKEIEV